MHIMVLDMLDTRAVLLKYMRHRLLQCFRVDKQSLEEVTHGVLSLNSPFRDFRQA